MRSPGDPFMPDANPHLQFSVFLPPPPLSRDDAFSRPLAPLPLPHPLGSWRVLSGGPSPATTRAQASGKEQAHQAKEKLTPSDYPEPRYPASPEARLRTRPPRTTFPSMLCKGRALPSSVSYGLRSYLSVSWLLAAGVAFFHYSNKKRKRVGEKLFLLQ